jgi:hypothetical protein
VTGETAGGDVGRLGVRELAIGVLGIDDEARLDEIAEMGSLLELITTRVRHLQSTRPEEPPPTPIFTPSEFAPDFWRGRPNDD